MQKTNEKAYGQTVQIGFAGLASCVVAFILGMLLTVVLIDDQFAAVNMRIDKVDRSLGVLRILSDAIDEEICKGL